MLAPALIFVTGLMILVFGIQAFLTADRRKFANETIKAATMMIMGLFLLYFWQVTFMQSSGGYNTKGGYY